jgi:hypothetical protein
MLRRLDDILHADFLWLAREHVSAAGAANGLDQSRAPQAQQDLFDVVVRETFLLGQLAGSDRTLARPLGEMNRDD